jgi:hypothetical protein
MAKNLKWLVVGLVAVLAFFALRSCGGPNEKYWIKKALYDQAVADAAAQHVTDMGTIVTQEGTITARDADIANLKAVIVQKSAKITGLAHDLAALQAAEPAQPELETQPLVISLRAQIGNLTKLYSISVEIIDTKDAVIADWTAKFNAQAVISETWKAAYETEHRLRLTAEELNITLEHQRDASRLYGKLTTAGLAAAGAYLLLTK